MPRVDAIWHDATFQRHLQRLAELERDRVYCRHGLTHLLDVARIMWIRCLEEQLGLDRELVYATALLHDIGKDEQYETGIPHDVVGARVAREVLEALPARLNFSAAEVDEICAAIAGHRRLREGARPLERLLFGADKASRACYACAAADTCNWSDDKKNLAIRM